MEIWQKNPNPSLVLIDGRMRKACFAASLLNAESETTILFDDYSDRSHYHEVEQIVKPSLIIGRMAEFIIHPKMIDKRMFKELIPWFFSLQ